MARKKKRERECGRKVAYDTLEQADAAARRPGKKLNAWGFMLGYRCRYCKKFHYGHPPVK